MPADVRWLGRRSLAGSRRVAGLRCEDAASLLPGLVDDSTTVSSRRRRRVEAHVAGCLRCQADLAAYRRVRLTLRNLHPSVEGLDEPDVLVGRSRQADRKVWLAGLGGGAAGAAAATAVVVAVIMARRPTRRRRRS